ncbi:MULTISPECIES: hypothetical protein [unclassified Micromonospora]|uniref:hypothetical protein n=1 Tax=unclassified Micromonospora TaxID=2617518 RepID=UPI00331DFDF2
MTDRARLGAVALLAISAVVGVTATLSTLGFVSESGSTSGSWTRGVVDGLEHAAVPLLLAGALAAAAVGLARRSALVRVLAVAAALLSVGGVLVAGARGAVARYDQLARLPSCHRAQMAGSPVEPVAQAVQAAFADIEHPWRFSGAGSTGMYGCGTTLLNVSFERAAAHYRAELPAVGWAVTHDDSWLTAHRDGLVFVLSESPCGNVAITIKPAEAIMSPEVC